MIFASGTWFVNTVFTGSTTSELGAAPKLHCIVAHTDLHRHLESLLTGYSMTNCTQTGFEISAVLPVGFSRPLFESIRN